MRDGASGRDGEDAGAREAAGVDRNALAAATELIEAELAAGTFPGAALVCTLGGRVFLERFWGVYCSRTRADEPLVGGETHMVYSFSKGIAATAFAIARDEGLLDYDRPIGEDIPGFGRQGKEGITPRLLLCHAGGIPSAPVSAMHDDAAWAEAVEAICGLTPKWPPGSQTEYHAATGVLLVAEVVRRRSGVRFRDYCRQKVFDPLGMDSTGYEVPAEEVRLALTPPPARLPCAVTPATYGMIGRPGGGAFSTIPDMLKLIHLHLAGGVWEGRRLIREETFEALHTIQFEREIREDLEAGRPPRHASFGLGWALTGPGRNASSRWFGMGNTSYGSFGHAGIDTVMGIGDPGRDLGIVFLTTTSPRPSDDNTRRIRTAVTDHIVAAVPPNTTRDGDVK